MFGVNALIIPLVFVFCGVITSISKGINSILFELNYLFELVWGLGNILIPLNTFSHFDLF